MGGGIPQSSRGQHMGGGGGIPQSSRGQHMMGGGGGIPQSSRGQHTGGGGGGEGIPQSNRGQHMGGGRAYLSPVEGSTLVADLGIQVWVQLATVECYFGKQTLKVTNTKLLC